MSVRSQIDRISENVSAALTAISQKGVTVPAGSNSDNLKSLISKIEVFTPGGSFTYPDSAFAPVTSFTNGKQYALVALIDGVYRYINTTTYNNYTMNATTITIDEDVGNYVVFGATPVLFTAVASGDGFLLQNGSNYLYGTSSGGTSLRVGTTQAVWTVDNSATGGFSDGKYYAKEDANAVWLINTTGGYNWSIKYETAGSFGYDRNGRDSTYSTGFVSFILHEYVAGEEYVSPIVDTSDAKVTANQMLAGASGYANGKLIEGNIQSKGAATITPSTTAQYIEPGVYLDGRQTISAIQTQTKTVTSNGTVTPDSGKYLTSVVVEVPASGITPSGTRSITSNGTYDVTNYASAQVNVPSGASIGSAYTKLSANGDSISFTGLTGRPKMFTFIAVNAFNVASDTASITSVCYTGETLQGTTISRTQSGTTYRAASGFIGSVLSWTYSDGTLTVTTTSGQFYSGTNYYLYYAI